MEKIEMILLQIFNVFWKYFAKFFMFSFISITYTLKEIKTRIIAYFVILYYLIYINSILLYIGFISGLLLFQVASYYGYIYKDELMKFIEKRKKNNIS